VKISIGALAGNWTRTATMAFYDAVALSPADIVYIGTAIHSPLAGLRKRDCLAVARELEAGGKEVVLSVRAAAGEWDAESFNAWIADCTLAVEVSDARTFQMLAAKVPLVIGTGVPCASADTLTQLVGLGAKRWVTPAVCKGEVVKMLAYAAGAGCEIEQPVLSPRHFSRWQRRVEDCPYEGSPMHGMPGCDRETSLKRDAPDWADDLEMLRTAGVEILRVTPRHVRDVEVSQILSELVRGEVGAREAYERYAESSGHAGTQVTAVPLPRHRRLADSAGAAVS
jgi:O2-independent ubiquinone biosynthesis protein UbiV